MLAIVGLCYIVVQAYHRMQRQGIMTFDTRSGSAGVENDTALPEPVSTQNIKPCDDNTRPTCKYYYRGHCRKQDRCMYYHDPESPAAKLTEPKISRMFAELDWIHAVELIGLLLDARRESDAHKRAALLDHVAFLPQDSNPDLPHRMVIPLDGPFPTADLKHLVACLNNDPEW